MFCLAFFMLRSVKREGLRHGQIFQTIRKLRRWKRAMEDTIAATLHTNKIFLQTRQIANQSILSNILGWPDYQQASLTKPLSPKPIQNSHLIAPPFIHLSMCARFRLRCIASAALSIALLKP